MKIALAGATGNVGTCLTSELTRRVHHVTAIARHPEKNSNDKPPSARGRAKREITCHGARWPRCRDSQREVPEYECLEDHCCAPIPGFES
jgi:nucleoside-diphosphate-sugar epimerase